MVDDGAGQELLTHLERNSPEWDSQVEFVDGGTQGLALLGQFDGRKAVILLDAIRLGEKPGTVHVLTGSEVVCMAGRAGTAHEGGAPQILAALQLLGDMPQQVVVIGLEPERIETGIGLSTSVQTSLEAAACSTRAAISKILAAI